MNPNPSPSPLSPEAEDTAALWAARFEGGELTDSLRRELAAWLAADERHLGLLASYRRLSLALERQLPALAAAGAVASPAPPAPASRPAAARRRFGYLPAFAAAAAAVAIGAAVWLNHARSQPRPISTGPGERRTVILADGSRVELNARTTLLVADTPSERRVRLIDGDGFFVVSKNRERPFVVETAAGSVRVTGTIFNVSAETPSELDVTVVEGSVQVRAGDGDGAAPVALTAGDWFSAASGEGPRHLSSEGVEDALAWRDGDLVCKDMPLAAALARFAHYNGVSIDVAPGAAHLPVSGRVSLGNLDSFLAAIASSLPVRVDHAPGGAIHVKLRTGS